VTTDKGDVDVYIDGFDGITRARLIAVRELVLRALPEATERISYKIPAYVLGKYPIVSFAGYAKHIGLYPMPAGDDAFRAALAPYASGKSSARFPHDQPLPAALITRIVELRVRERPPDDDRTTR
jgi:uncharacterized protein YdhG (YjbR/CyaY superfamily)